MSNGRNGHVSLTGLPIERRVRALRKLLGWTQVELAEAVGVDVRSVKRWEAGQVPAEEAAYALARVAPKAFKATPDWFFEPPERREERLLELEERLVRLERRMKRAGL